MIELRTFKGKVKRSSLKFKERCRGVTQFSGLIFGSNHRDNQKARQFSQAQKGKGSYLVYHPPLWERTFWSGGGGKQ